MRILVADDSPVYRTMLKNLLEEWGYDVVLVADGTQAHRVLDSDHTPPLAILDCVMPGLTGLDLCKIIRTRKQSYVYTILLSANGEQADVMKGFELGADDYLRKPFEELELKARLKVGERIICTQEELFKAREALLFEATHDCLMRLWNRKAILDLLAQELSRAIRLGTPLSIFLADLDFFKNINDCYGHLVGDDVLRTVASGIARTVREYDYVGRYGGEEFLVVLPNCNEDAAHDVAERVRRHIAEEPILNTPAKVQITVSIGLCCWQFGQELVDLLHATDLALYRAKRNGRNCVERTNTTGAVEKVLSKPEYHAGSTDGTGEQVQ
jgi:diguanylate cyclase (GGDEF)-like protein